MPCFSKGTSDVEMGIKFYQIDKHFLFQSKLCERKSPIITLSDIQCTDEFCSASTEIKIANNNNIYLELLTEHL